MDMIHSKNEFAMKASLKQLKGAVSDKVRVLRDDILYEIAFIESALDDPEHISLDGYHEKLETKTELLLAELKKLIDSADNGKLLKDGINTVIVGKPNAGKSSLLNRLVGEDKAIVTSVAGTTRDVLEETIKLHGIGLNIIDTAGIRDTEDEVEKIGVEKARKYAEDADLVIFVVDSSRPLDENDEEPVTLYDENDKETEFEQVAIIPLEEKIYVILKPITKIEGVADDEGLVFVIEEIDDEDMLVLVDDDEIINKVFDVYYQLLKEDEE